MRSGLAVWLGLSGVPGAHSGLGTGLNNNKILTGSRPGPAHNTRHIWRPPFVPICGYRDRRLMRGPSAGARHDVVRLTESRARPSRSGLLARNMKTEVPLLLRPRNLSYESVQNHDDDASRTHSGCVLVRLRQEAANHLAKAFVKLLAADGPRLIGVERVHERLDLFLRHPLIE